MRVPTAASMALAACALAACALALAGCASKQAALPHAVYANAVPIYPGAVLEDAMGSTSTGDTSGSASDGMAWFFDVEAPAERMIAFYEKKLPGAKRDPVWQEGVRLVWVPPGASPGEEVAVVIDDNELTIHEEVKPGKRPGNPNATSPGTAGQLGAADGSTDDH
jgi:hypothetical protein